MAWSPSGKAKVCKTFIRGFNSRPGLPAAYFDARVAELVYAHDLKSCPERGAGSMPAPSTRQIYPPIAQLVEQLPLKEMVGGSIPSGRTSEKNLGRWWNGRHASLRS